MKQARMSERILAAFDITDFAEDVAVRRREYLIEDVVVSWLAGRLDAVVDQDKTVLAIIADELHHQPSSTMSEIADVLRLVVRENTRLATRANALIERIAVGWAQRVIEEEEH